MTRTHIRGVSGILTCLQLQAKFQDTDYSKAKVFVESHPYSYDTETMRIKNWVNNFTRYFGDANNDLRQLRLKTKEFYNLIM